MFRGGGIHRLKDFSAAEAHGLEKSDRFVHLRSMKPAFPIPVTPTAGKDKKIQQSSGNVTPPLMCCPHRHVTLTITLSPPTILVSHSPLMCHPSPCSGCERLGLCDSNRSHFAFCKMGRVSLELRTVQARAIELQNHPEAVQKIPGDSFLPIFFSCVTFSCFLVDSHTNPFHRRNALQQQQQQQQKANRHFLVCQKS